MTPAERERVLRRIRACLRLAASPEPHEAAAALRQAQAWMRRYGLTRDEVELSHAATGAGSRALRPRAWVATLIALVGRAFAVHPIYLPARGGARVEFIGRDVAAQVAVYAYEVLRRQLARDRAAMLRRMKRLKRTTRVRRAEVYCEGWVSSVAERVHGMARGLPPREDIERYLAVRGRSTELVETQSRRMRKGDLGAMLAGLSDGAQAVLHHGVGDTAMARIEAPAWASARGSTCCGGSCSGRTGATTRPSRRPRPPRRG